MHVHNTSNSGRKPLRHPTEAAVRYASGEKIRNLPRLQKHLAQCVECSDTVLFIQKFINAMQRQGTENRPTIDEILKNAGLDKEQIAEIWNAHFKRRSGRLSPKEPS